MRHRFGVLEQVLQVGAQEVRHPDGADGACPASSSARHTSRFPLA
ncbi:hypothetical protein FM106_10965 [Brachybacterium faecium]|nr:hypothetical protein FM106_10965 [Brachybacterium faecium]